MANVIVASAGTTGPRGPAWLSGAGAPVANAVGSLEGDFYLDTTNVGFYYGPRTNGLWGTPHPFGNSLNGVPLVNVTATTAPGAANDNTQGYTRGSYWLNTTNNQYYICANAATGAAVWQNLIPVGNAAGGDLSGTLPNPVVAKIQTIPINAGSPTGGQVLTGVQGGGTGAWLTPTNITTGLIGGGVMTQASSTSFSITQGLAIIADYVTTPLTPTVNRFTIPAQTITLTAGQLAQGVTWWVSDTNGNITSLNAQPTADQRRTSIQLGVVITSANVIVQVVSDPVYPPQIANQLQDLIYALGVFSTQGNQITANGANLSMNKSAGMMFSGSGNYAADPNNLHSVSNPAETPVSFRYVTQLTNSFSANKTVLDPTSYDNGGVITAIGGGSSQSTIQRVFLAATGTAGTQLTVQYGNVIYPNLSTAQQSIGAGPFLKNPDIGLTTLIAWVVTTRICTSLQDTTNASIILANKFATP